MAGYCENVNGFRREGNTLSTRELPILQPAYKGKTGISGGGFEEDLIYCYVDYNIMMDLLEKPMLVVAGREDLS